MATLIADNETGQINDEAFKGQECPNCGQALMHGQVEGGVRFKIIPSEDEQYSEGRAEGTCAVKVCLSCGYLRTNMEIEGYDGY